ncbi:RING finger protein 17-like isoform X2 [Chrysoperla carnea]|uniref:RING finger protein 17-like isoform X2 n=1 Tax=Chrysoperla carnea TaxID=189513 RepID=UPI001D078C5D|nr:RING finger protein 17-like isoform X2 [Chrysoperla carnea]
MHSSTNKDNNYKFKKYHQSPNHNNLSNVLYKSQHKCPNCQNQFQVQINNTWRPTNNSGPQSFAEANERNRHQRLDFQNNYDCSLKQGYKNNLTRLPLLLECGHTVCEKCIRGELEISSESMVKCRQCQVPTVIDAIELKNSEFYTYFPINYYIAGIFFIEKALNITTKTKFTTNNEYMLKPPTLVNTNPSKTMRRADAVSKPICCECRIQLSSVKCKECDLTLCNTCFGIIHKPKCFSHHKPIPISNKATTSKNSSSEQLDIGLSNCTVHVQRPQPLEFHCITCQIDTCQICVLTTHQGHKITEVAQVNQNYVDEVKEKVGVVRALNSDWENALKKVESRLSHQQAPKVITTIENSIQEHFQEAHGRLQIVENRIRNELNTLQFKNVLSLQQAQKQLKDYLERGREIVNKTKLLDNPKNLANLNVATLLHQIKDLFAIDKNDLLIEEIDTEAIRLNIDADFLQSIDDHCSLDFDCSKSSQLIAIEDLSEVVSPNAVSISGNISEVSFNRDDQSVKDNLNRSDSEMSIHSICLPRCTPRRSLTSPTISTISATAGSLKNTPIKPLTEGTCVRVYLSHIKNPSLFYVQHQEDANTHSEFSRQYTQYAKKSEIPEFIELNEMYFVYFDSDKKWYRGQVRKIINNQENDEQQNYEIFFVDYGNTKIVSIDKLRVIPDHLKSHRPKAFRCGLFDLKPRNGEWTEEATKIVLRLIDKSNINMYIMKIVGDLYLVDLLTTSKETCQLPTSIRDALIFLEYGCFEERPSISSKFTTIDVKKKEYLRREFSIQEIHDVTVSHIVSPQKFYIQMIMYSEYLHRLMKNLKKKYSIKEKRGTIYNPQIGMTCAVHYDEKWYRGLITNLPGNRQVDVQQVDYGEIVRVDWNEIRILNEEFRQMNIQAILCTLTDVQSMTSKNDWSEEAIDCFKDMIKNSYHLQIQVNTNGKPLHVTLFDVLPTKNININAELVEKNFAKSTGVSSRCAEYYNLDGLGESDPVPKIEILKREDLNKKSSRRKGNNENRYSKKIKTPTMLHNPPPQPTTPTPPILVKPGEPTRVKINVLSAINPECIYVRLFDRNTDIAKLQDALQSFYLDIPYNEALVWEVGNRCAVCVDNEWYRAIIESINENDDNLIKVFIKDFAKYETVNRKQLRTLDPTFLTVRDGSIKCELYGIKAAGDKNTWPMLACEELRDLLNTESDIYITKRGEVTENRALPVDFWIYETIPGRALEPSTSKWILINDVLVERGLVIPKKNNIDVNASFEESKLIDTVSDWLQIADLDLAQQKFVEHWIEADPLTTHKFKGIITHIDANLNIYLHDACDNKLHTIQTRLQKHFNGSKAEMYDMFWQENQPCIARNPDDDQFYRGLVQEILSNDIICVLFIDYGYTKHCRTFDLRKNLILENIPTQALKCQLSYVKPKSKVMSSTFEKYVSDFLLNEEFLIEVTENVNDKISIDVNLGNGKTLANVLVSKKWACPIDKTSIDSDSSVIVEDIDSISMIDESESFVTYKSIILPPDLDDEIEIEVISAGIDGLTWYIRLGGQLAEQLGKKSAYDDLLDRMQDEAAQQPQIIEPQVGQACCALYKEDNQWYRGEIMAPIYSNSNSLIVIFADYGNIEQVPREDVRHIKDEWLTIPMQCLQAKIHGMNINKDVDNFEGLMEEFTEVLFNIGSVAKIHDRDENNKLKVEIFNLEGKLKYESFIEKGLLVPLV